MRYRITEKRLHIHSQHSFSKKLTNYKKLTLLLAKSVSNPSFSFSAHRIHNFFLNHQINISLKETQDWLHYFQRQLPIRQAANWGEILTGKRVISIHNYRKAELAVIQDQLRALDYPIQDNNGKYRGIYGNQTIKALKHFQKIMKKTPDGTINHEILILLINTMPAQLPSGLQKKPGAILYPLHPKIIATFPKITKTWNKLAAPTPVITSGNDSKHKTNSKHYSNRAIDLRGNNLPKSTLKKIAKNLQTELGKDYLVIAEFFPKHRANDHIHLQYSGK